MFTFYLSKVFKSKASLHFVNAQFTHKDGIVIARISSVPLRNMFAYFRVLYSNSFRYLKIWFLQMRLKKLAPFYLLIPVLPENIEISKD